jgi:mono/diheme cytochrome c family protein
MKHAPKGVAASLMLVALLSQMSFAQPRVDLGKSEYESSCASCHGVSGKGDGAMVGMLTKPPSDLTTLARQNGGVFPVQRISEMIDGRTSVMIGSHGAREMPVWGHVYRSEDTQPRDLHARNRISSLVDYLARIQGK